MEYLNVSSSKGNLIKGHLIIKPKIFFDDRGYFFESWNHSEFNKIISRQVNLCKIIIRIKIWSNKGTSLSITSKAQAKLVRCSKGKFLMY